MSAARKSLSRDIVTPVTIVTFVVSTVTGIMLLAHWNSGLVRFSHEWLSVVFGAIAVWHLARNWKAFTGYLRRRPAVIAFALSLIASVAVTAATAETTTGGGPRAIIGAVANAPLAVAAPALGLTPERAVEKLAAAGIVVSDPSETLTAIGTRAGLGGFGVASLLATPPNTAP